MKTKNTKELNGIVSIVDYCQRHPYIIISCDNIWLKVRANYLAYYEAKNAIWDKKPRNIKYHTTAKGDNIADYISEI